jgi:hypothetical protein
MANKEQEENPLADLYVDASEVDRERIRDAISGFIGIDTETAKPVLREGFSSLPSKKQFTALLLYRRALLSLDELDEDVTVGQGSAYFADLIGVDDSTIRHAATIWILSSITTNKADTLFHLIRPNRRRNGLIQAGKIDELRDTAEGRLYRKSPISV